MAVAGGLLDVAKAAAPVAVGAGLLATPEDAEAIFLKARPDRLLRAQERGDFLPEKATPENLAKAQEMYARNESPRKIYSETGFFKGADGGIRFEVPDDQARVSGLLPRQADVRQLTTDVLDSDYGSLLADNIGTPQVIADERLSSAGYRGTYSPFKNQIAIEEGLLADPEMARSVFMHELQHAAQTSQGMAGGANAQEIQDRLLRNFDRGDGLGDLSEVAREFDNAIEGLRSLGKFERLKRYEQLSRDENLTGKQRLLFGNSQWYQHGSEITRRLGVMPKRHRPKAERNAWLSAAWQQLADMERNRVTAYDYQNLNRVLNAKRGEAMGLLRIDVGPDSLDTTDLQSLKRARSRVERYLDKRRGKAQELHQIKTRKREIQTADPYDLYKRTAGEVEARNVQTRLGMTPQERYESYPPDTEDVPRASQLFPDSPMQRGQYAGFATPAALIPTAAIGGGSLLAANEFGEMPTVSQSTPAQRFTEGVLGGADFLANAGSAVAEPFITAAQTLRALPTNTPTSEIEAQRAAYQNSLDYQPRTEIGRNATESALGLLGGALQGPMAAGKAIAEPLIPIYDAAAEQYKRLPRRVQLGAESLLDLF